MKEKNRLCNFIKPVCVSLAAVLSVTSVLELMQGESLSVKAAEDTLPGIEQIRNEMSDGDVYEIVELVPKMLVGDEGLTPYIGGTVGFYVAGNEPFPCLYDSGYQVYRQWQEKLLSFENTSALTAKQQREQFMAQLGKEASYILDSLSKDGEEPPFTYVDYVEVTSDEYKNNPSLYEDYSAISGVPISKWGYLQSQENGDWLAVFEPAPSNLLAEEVYEGKQISYYQTDVITQYTYKEIYQLSQNESNYFNPLYSLRSDGRTFEYVGDAGEIWDGLYGDDKLFTVSNGDTSIPPGIKPVSTGDSYPALDDLSPYCAVTFKIINDGTAITPTNPEDIVKAVYVLVDSFYMEDQGGYNVFEADHNVTAVKEFVEPGETIYYKGGLVNHDFYKTKVLGLSLEECAGFHVNVKVVTPDMLNESCYNVSGEFVPSESPYLKHMDLLYVNSSVELGGLFKKTNPYGYVEDLPGTFSDERYVFDYDLQYDVMKFMVEQIVKKEIGCIIDISSFADVSLYENEYDGKYLGGENLGKLVGFLLYSQTERLELMATDTKFEKALKYLTMDSQVSGYLLGTNDVFAADTDDKDLCFVKDNVWFWNNSHDMPFLHGGFLEKYHYNLPDGTVSSSYFPVYEEIVSENLYREADSGYTEQLLDTNVYERTVWRYITNYSRRRPTGSKYANEQLKVLVLEPATNNTSKIDITKNNVHKWTGVAEEKIVWDVMSMNQFIGCIDDLNAKYDLIYIGGSMDKLYTKVQNGQTIIVYGDQNMNGLLYSHVGDIQSAHPMLAGLLDTDYTNPENKAVSNLVPAVKNGQYRYNGNDITLEKYNALLDFLDASYPVVIADNLLVKQTDGSYVANSFTVDNSSYLYEFINVALQHDNTFAKGDLPDITQVSNSKNAMFDFYINKPKLKIMVADAAYPEIVMSTEKYSYKLSNNTVTNNSITQISRDLDGNYYLRYMFKIQNYGAVSYDENYSCKLYLDANADGKFSKEFEELTVDITEIATGRKLSGPEKQQLKQDKVYVVTARVPDTYFGCITWNLEITQTDNPYIRSGKKGYTKLKTDSQAAEINILQIYYNDANNSINLEDSVGTWNGSEYVKGTYATNYFNSLANAVKDDYRLNITTISKTEFDNGYKNGSPRDLTQYDMLILGFSDAKNGIDWEYGIGDIQAFIQSGKSVLMAHDMTSYINVDNKGAKVGSDSTNYYEIGKKNEYYWNYQMNSYIRDLVGMDMYGITNNSFNSEIKTGYPLNLAESSVVQPTKNKNGRYNYTYTYKDSAGAEKFSIIKDIAYTPRSARQTTVKEVQGYNAIALNQRSNSTLGSDGYGRYRNGFQSSASNVMTTSALCINEGQITNYPFDIGQEPSGTNVFEQETTISVGNTHNQYYTLDMNSDSDNDGQTDIVVWYTLNGGSYNNNYGDVMNNYYIYSKGNVIYTGMGHNAQSGNFQNAVTEEEAKLFINTIIAAYNTGTKTPYITTLDGSGVETRVLYSYWDPLIEDSTGDYIDYSDISGEGAVELGFKITDLNMTQGAKTSLVKYYIEVGDIANVSSLVAHEPEFASRIYELSSERHSVYPVLLDCPGEMLSGQYVLDVTEYLQSKTEMNGAGDATVDLGKIEVGTEYYVEVPIKYFDTRANGFDTQFYVGTKTTMVKSSITGSKIVTETPWGYQSLKYVNVELFDLD